jgi:hypothetical protein
MFKSKDEATEYMKNYKINDNKEIQNRVENQKIGKKEYNQV